MFKLFSGKPRTNVGRFLDDRGISQEFLVKKTKISRATVSKICSDTEYTPTLPTIKKIMNVLKEIDPKAKSNDFFDI